ncbi:MAG: MFS transporter [Pseudolabrys sp.]|nr:MFS transporter [Pseudolabrys sp.]
MLGNIAIGLSVLAPAGMLAELARDLDVTIRDAGLLVTYGAVVLCVSSPLSAWLTSRIDRRVLLAATIGILAACEAATAFAPNYASVLVLRLIMLAAAALYTPQAAATIAMIVPEKARPSAIAFVFLGWSLAIAAGLPTVTFLTQHFGWREAFAVLAGLGAIITILLLAVLPPALRGRELSLASFGVIARNGRIVLILLITLLTTSGQFSVVIYLTPILERLTGRGAATAAVLFAMMGTLGLIGNLIATSVVGRFGLQKTFAFFTGSLTLGLVLWAAGAGMFAVMGAGIAFLGLGFAASNSMQQARLAEAAPDFAGASIAMNTSILYVGQALGSGIGGWMFAFGHYSAAGYVAAAFGVAAMGLVILTWQRKPRRLNP